MHILAHQLDVTGPGLGLLVRLEGFLIQNLLEFLGLDLLLLLEGTYLCFHLEPLLVLRLLKSSVADVVSLVSLQLIGADLVLGLGEDLRGDEVLLLTELRLHVLEQLVALDGHVADLDGVNLDTPARQRVVQVVLDLCLDEATIPENVQDRHISDAVTDHRDAHVSQLLSDLSMRVAAAQLIAERLIQLEDIILIRTPDERALDLDELHFLCDLLGGE